MLQQTQLNLLPASWEPKKEKALEESKAVTHKKTAAIREEISDWTKI